MAGFISSIMNLPFTPKQIALLEFLAAKDYNPAKLDAILESYYVNHNGVKELTDDLNAVLKITVSASVRASMFKAELNRAYANDPARN